MYERYVFTPHIQKVILHSIFKYAWFYPLQKKLCKAETGNSTMTLPKQEKGPFKGSYVEKLSIATLDAL